MWSAHKAPANRGEHNHENYEEDWSSKDELVAETSKHDRLGGLGTCRTTRPIGRVADGSKCQVVFDRSAKYRKNRGQQPDVEEMFLWKGLKRDHAQQMCRHTHLFLPSLFTVGDGNRIMKNVMDSIRYSSFEKLLRVSTSSTTQGHQWSCEEQSADELQMRYRK
ncbi:hypothetical protein T07_14538 [Trichinella nelsoni]|uniref:Uncharacterized protein n=1 Tax=Trichinella nelsoni TaxID=6336 RepID=A0A0V0S0C5_9BILA|nr:hypothetical protein T07_14538 [Trichinella nelsoni]